MSSSNLLLYKNIVFISMFKAIIREKNKEKLKIFSKYYSRKNQFYVCVCYLNFLNHLSLFPLKILKQKHYYFKNNKFDNSIRVAAYLGLFYQVQPL